MGQWAAALAIAVVATGCGPSLRRVQQSRVYFERCYAADFDARIPLAEKHACWSAWIEHYTIGQPPDRADYARDRVYAIEHGESVPRLPGLPEVALGPRRVTTVMAVSSESTPEATPEPDPPASAEEEHLTARERRRRRPPTMPRTVNPACAIQACEPSWQRCVDTCPHDAGEGCQTACEVELQNCARGCY